MTKNERIAKLEEEIKELKARIARLEARPPILVDARSKPLPTYDPYSSGNHPPWYPPDYVVCGTGTVSPADILPGTADERIE